MLWHYQSSAHEEKLSLYFLEFIGKITGQINKVDNTSMLHSIKLDKINSMQISYLYLSSTIIYIQVVNTLN